MREESPSRLIIVDDHDLVRSGIRAMLSGESGLEVVGEAADGREALELCQRMRPDLVLMDVRMANMDGLAATREIKSHLPDSSVLILTMHEHPEYMLEAIRAGAAGYVLKDAQQSQLVATIREVLDGETVLSPRLASRLLQRLANEEPVSTEKKSSKTGNAELADPLTPRELEVLRLLVSGKTNREIAGKLVISLGTAKNHVEHILAKLGVSDRTQAVVRSFELGIVDTPGR